jgi:hypothetical protein
MHDDVGGVEGVKLIDAAPALAYGVRARSAFRDVCMTEPDGGFRGPSASNFLNGHGECHDRQRYHPLSRGRR